MMLQSHWGSLYRCMDGDFVAFLDSYGGDFTRRFQKWWFNNLRSFGDSYPKNCVALSLAAPNNEWDFTKAKLCCTLASTALPFIWWRCMQKNIKSRSVIHNRNKSRTIEIKIHSMSAANTTYKSFTIQDQRCQKKMRISAVQKRAEKGALGPSNLQGQGGFWKKTLEGVGGVRVHLIGPAGKIETRWEVEKGAAVRSVYHCWLSKIWVVCPLNQRIF